MAVFVTDTAYDAALDVVATGTILTVCSALPTTRTEAVTTYKLADVVIDSGDFTKADGAVDGRKVTVGAQDGVTVDASDTATHIAICDDTNVLLVTTCTNRALVAGDTVNVPAFAFTVRDAS